MLYKIKYNVWNKGDGYVARAYIIFRNSSRGRIEYGRAMRDLVDDKTKTLYHKKDTYLYDGDKNRSSMGWVEI